MGDINTRIFLMANDFAISMSIWLQRITKGLVVTLTPMPSLPVDFMILTARCDVSWRIVNLKVLNVGNENYSTWIEV